MGTLKKSEGIVLTRTKPKKPVPLSDRQRRLVAGFLHERLTAAQEGHRAAKIMFELDPDSPHTRGQMEYWAHVVSALAWAASYIPLRQRFLTEGEDVAE